MLKKKKRREGWEGVWTKGKHISINQSNNEKELWLVALSSTSYSGGRIAFGACVCLAT